MQPSDLGNKARSIQASQLPMLLAAGLGVSIVLHVGAIAGIAYWWKPPAAQPDAPIEVTLIASDPITRTQPPDKPSTRSKIVKPLTPKPVIAKVKPAPVKPASSPKSIVRSQPRVPPALAPTPPPFDLPIPTKSKSPPATPQILSPKLARSRRQQPIASSSPQTSSPTPLPADKTINPPQTPKPVSPRAIRVNQSMAPSPTITPKLGGTPGTPSSSSAGTSRSPVTSQNAGGSGGILTDGNRSTGNETGGTGNGSANGVGSGGDGGNGNGNFIPNLPTGNTPTASPDAGKLECIRNCEVPKLKDLQDLDRGKDRLRIRIVIDANGLVTAAEVAKSSGNPQVDRAAVEGIRQMQFVPSGKQISGIIRANILIRSAVPSLVQAIA